MKCLVLGGGGFQGSHLCDALLEAGYSVRVFDRVFPQNANIPRASGEIEFIEGNFADAGCLERAVSGTDFIYHLVSTTIPKTSNDDAVYDVSSNLIPTLSLLEIARRNKIRKVVFFSSGGTVYGVPEYVPIDEGHSTNPVCSYGIHKLAIEKYLHMFHNICGIDYAVLRVANPFGERQNPSGCQGAVNVFTRKALKGEPIEIWGDGSVVRDYIHVSDVIRAAISVLDYKGKHKIFNIGTGIGRSLLDVTREIEAVLDRALNIDFMQARAVDVPANILDISRATKELSWVPQVSFREGVKRTAAYILPGVQKGKRARYDYLYK